MEESRRCTECGHQVSEGARFCEECGASLTLDSKPLRAPAALAQKILGERASIEGERKQVTVMFADIVGSMELTRLLEAERWGLVLDRFLAIASSAIHDLEGTVNQFTGDGLMAVFGAPVAHEDHARRACLATLQLHRELSPLAEELARDDGVEFAIRCGLNSGEVIVGSIGDDLHMDFAPIGNTTGLAKRMETLAPHGSTALSASTASLVEGEFELRQLGEFEVKGMVKPQRLVELIGPGAAQTKLEAVAEARGLSRFVGRGAERSRLETALGRALSGDGDALGIKGEPGVGKSRLVRVFVGECRARGLIVTRANAVAHGRSVPLLPVLAMFRSYFGIEDATPPVAARGLIESALANLDGSFDAELPIVFDFLGVPDPERPAERIDPEARQRRLLGFVEDLVRAQSHREPAILVIEDLQWLDDASAVFLAKLVEAVAGTRTLLLTTYRPEYRAGWLDDVPEREMDLAPLDPEESGELIVQLLGDDASLAGLVEAISEQTSGNPFFIEEVVQALVETGHVAGDSGAYRLARPLDEVVLPPTVQAVLSARIDRLEPREKTLVQTMSVIGKEVPEPVLREVSTVPDAELADSLALLEEAEFLLEPTSNGHREFAFKHPLTQEVAYASQLSEPRARAHGAVAGAIERLYPDGLDERAALLAHHAEQAGKALAAAQWHARAAAWVSVSSPADGMRHWRRVREITDELENSPEVDQLAMLARISILALAWRLGMSHEEIAAIHAEGQERLASNSAASPPGVAEDQGEAVAPDAEDEAERQRLMLDFMYAASLIGSGREREGVQRARSILPALRADPVFIAGAAGVAWGMFVLGDIRGAIELAEEGLALAGDDVECGAGGLFENPYSLCLGFKGVFAAFEGNAAEGIRDLDRSVELARSRGDEESEAYLLDLRLLVNSLFGELERAGEDARRIAEVASSLDIASAQGLVGISVANLARGDFAAAESAAQRALVAIREQEGLDLVPFLLIRLSAARLGDGRPADAMATAEEAVELTQARSLKVPEILAQLTLTAALQASDGERLQQRIEAALSRALGLANETGALATEPQIHNALAALARLRGNEAEAEREEAEAERILADVGFSDEVRRRVQATRPEVGKRAAAERSS
jgi:class 3 adenylate cyclase